MIDTDTCVGAYTSTGDKLLISTWVKTMESEEAPVERAASAKSMLRTCDVAVSATRQSGGINTMVSVSS